MSDTNDVEFKIGIVGPSRVGKTSLVTSILANAKDLLAGSPVSIKAKDGKTRARISQHDNALRGSLYAREFDAGKMEGTQEAFEFHLYLGYHQSDEEQGVNLKLLDFPGKWMSPTSHAHEQDGDWARCVRFIEQSTVLLVIIDASLIMEAVTSKQKQAVPGILNVAEVEDVVRAWAKTRSQHTNQPGLLILCPVKCESYFADNGGPTDRSDELFRKVTTIYQHLPDIIEEENAGHTDILYMPVDTIGCVEFVEAEWREDRQVDGGYTFSPSFKVRGNGRLSVKGADGLLISISHQIVSFKEKVLHRSAEEKSIEAQYSARQAAENKTLLEDIGTWLFDYETSDEKYARFKKNDAEATMQKARNIGQVLQELTKKKPDSRMRVIYSGKKPS